MSSRINCSGPLLSMTAMMLRAMSTARQRDASSTTARCTGVVRGLPCTSDSGVASSAEQLIGRTPPPCGYQGAAHVRGARLSGAVSRSSISFIVRPHISHCVSGHGPGGRL
jgi:hypothetical protein